jgi:hypothetical protein
MPQLPKALSIATISAVIILLAASSSGCDDCVESHVFVKEHCRDIACCDADVQCLTVGQVGYTNRGSICGDTYDIYSRGSGFRLTGP